MENTDEKNAVPEPAVVEIDGHGVFTARWTMEQMTALMNTNQRLRSRTAVCMAFTVVSVLLSLVAVLIK